MNRCVLERIARAWQGCDKCVLSGCGRQNIVIGNGSELSGLMIVGEAPGADEDAQGVPFVGPSGKLLRKVANDVGIEIGDEAYITNIVACRPPQNRVPMPDEIEACRPRLEALVNAVKPNAILVLGGTALTSVIGKQGITRQRGKWFDTKWKWRRKDTVIPAIATFHPAAVLRSQKSEQKQQFEADLVAAYHRAYGTHLQSSG